MPVVAVAMVYSGGTALAAGAVGWAAVAAGATMVGGALSLVGTATGDKNLESDGMMLGTVGSLGMGLTGAGAKEAGSEMSKDAFMKAGTEGGTQSVGGMTDAAVASGTGVPSAGAAGSVTSNAMSAYDTKFMELMKANESAQQMNLIGNVGQGLSTAYTGHQQQKQADNMFNQRRADEQALIDERRRNMNVTGVVAPVAPRVVRPGIINPAAQVNPITGSGQTTMQIK